MFAPETGVAFGRSSAGVQMRAALPLVIALAAGAAQAQPAMPDPTRKPPESAAAIVRRHSGIIESE